MKHSTCIFALPQKYHLDTCIIFLFLLSVISLNYPHLRLSSHSYFSFGMFVLQVNM